MTEANLILERAKLCEHIDRYEDMVKEMKKYIELADGEALGEEERNLLSVAYKNVVGSRRSSWRVINTEMASQQKDKLKKVCSNMKEKIEDELRTLCKEVLTLLTDTLIPHPENSAAKIFYLKMKADYYRYMVEISSETTEQTREELTKKADSTYKDAYNFAKTQLPPTSPIRLGLALNYSVFFYEIKTDPKMACEMAKSAFDDAIAQLDDVGEDVYKDSTLIMQLLRDNLTLWKTEFEQEAEQDE